MSYLLKDLYSPAFYGKLTDALLLTVPAFDRDKFLKEIFIAEFESKELKERMKHTTNVIHRFFPKNYNDTIEIIKKTIVELRKIGIGEDGLAFMFLPDYIETYGMDDFDTSVEALEFVTQFVSCEFAVRPFILKYGDKMMRRMQQWSLHESHKVRRLASEGSRPRLPWAMGIPFLKKDPGAVLPILENLKHDPAEYVRRSVANNLNDIAKDHPGTVLEIAKKWAGISPETDALIKHGCRTLLKQGHPEILKHYGLNDHGMILKDFHLLTPDIRMGESLAFSFTIQNELLTEQKVRLEYAIYYKKQNGQHHKKVFKISERIYPAGMKVNILRKQKFVPITTRRFHLGNHRIAVIINGAEKQSSDFNLHA